MVRSRSLHIIILPTILLVLQLIGGIGIVATDFIVAARPNNLLNKTINGLLFKWLLVVIAFGTCYVSIGILARFWWVARAVREPGSLEQANSISWRGVITPLVQSGCVYSSIMVLSMIIMIIGNVSTSFYV